MRYDTQYAMSNAPCEVCGSIPSIHVSFLNSYPARVCEICRRDFQIYIMDKVEYKALCGVFNTPDLDGAEKFCLLFDLQKGMAPLVVDWFESKGVTYETQRSESEVTSRSFSISLGSFKTTFEWCRNKPEKVS